MAAAWNRAPLLFPSEAGQRWEAGNPDFLNFRWVKVLVVRSGFNGFVDYRFIVDALISVRNGGMRFASGSRPFEN